MKKRIFALLLSITLLFSAVVTPVSAESVNNFTVKVSDATATAGDDRVAVDILLEDNPGIAGFSFCVNYDTEKLVLVESKINIEDGYKVVAQPTGYGVNLAWTGPSGYSKDGKIATLYFNVPKDLTASEANIDIVYRAGYDSFYDSHEHDIAVNTVNGKISIAALQEADKPSVNIGGVSVNFGATDIVVPITVKNNPGIAGFSFCVNYDTSRLVLEDTKILLEGGYKVIGHPEGYAVNIAWTSTEAYTQDGTIAELHFSLKANANSGKAYINTAFREGYDSFYGFTNGTEQDIAFDAFNGYVDVNNHRFGDWVVTTPATCTATGLKTRTCTDCSKAETVVIPKVAHEYVAVVTAPTCTAKGYTTYTCKTCPDYYIDTYVDMVEHTLGKWEENIAPECEVKGEEIQKCTVCKAVINTRIVDETGHDFDDWFVVSVAKFNEDGQERRDCKNCDHFETKRIPMLSEEHTCSFTGAEEIIADPSCEESGSKKVYCNTPECGNYITAVIAPTGHTEDEWVVTKPEGCTEAGTKELRCASCKQVLQTDTIAATGHQYGNWVVTKYPTTTAEGEKIRECSLCHDIQVSVIEVLGTPVCTVIPAGTEEMIDYDSLEKALNETTGGVVKLIADVTVGTVILKPGVTLDLNGYILTADIFLAMNGATVLDGGTKCVGGGMLKIPEENLVFARDNGQGVIPVWNGVDGYLFTCVSFQQMARASGSGAAQYIFLPSLSNKEASALLFDGGADNGLKIQVCLTWNNGSSKQFYTYSDDLVKRVYDGTGRWVFDLRITGIAGITDMEASAVVVADCGAQVSSTDIAIVPG